MPRITIELDEGQLDRAVHAIDDIDQRLNLRLPAFRDLLQKIGRDWEAEIKGNVRKQGLILTGAMLADVRILSVGPRHLKVGTDKFYAWFVHHGTKWPSKSRRRRRRRATRSAPTRSRGGLRVPARPFAHLSDATWNEAIEMLADFFAGIDRRG